MKGVFLLIPSTTTQQHLVEDNLAFAYAIARRYQSYLGRSLDLDDLRQEATLGLIEAARRFDTERGFCFSTYAIFWVRRQIHKALHLDRTIRLPDGVSSEIRQLNVAQADFWQRSGRAATVEDLAAIMRCSRERIIFLIHLRQDVLSLEQSTDDCGEEGACLGQTLQAQDVCASQSQPMALQGLLAYLSTKERAVIEQRYQVGADATSDVEDIPLPYAEVARHLDIPDEQVKIVEGRAMRKMRFWAERQEQLC